MKCIRLFVLLLGWTTILYSQNPVSETVFFETGKHELASTAKEILNSLSSKILTSGDYNIEIQAHTDDRGGNTYNKRLAKRRAKSVQKYFEAQGIEIEKTIVESFGEENPQYSNEDEAGRQLNRRVDVLVQLFYVESLDELMGRLTGPKIQSYTLDPNKDTKVIGEQGTTLWIEAGIFAFEDGSLPEGEIELQLTETYKTADIMLAGLSTTSNGNLLETGGMINIQAFADGKPLQIQEGQDLYAGLPTEIYQDGMQLFLGAPADDGSPSDWIPTDQDYEKTVTAKLRLPQKPRAPMFAFLPPIHKPNYAGEPIPPGKPDKPIKPIEPKREHYKYDPPFFTKLKLGKKKIKEKEEQSYQKALSQYQIRKERYENFLLPNHQLELETYRKAYAGYEVEHQAWERKLQDDRNNFHKSPTYQNELERQKNNFKAHQNRYNALLEKWEEAKRRRIEEFENKFELVGNMNAQSLNNYVFAVNQIGWINCDRFYSLPKEAKTPLVINDPDEEKEVLYIVFKDLNSIIKPFKKDGNYLTSAIPKDAPIQIIGVKVMKGRPHLALQETVVQGNTPYDLAYEPCTLKDIRKALESLN